MAKRDEPGPDHSPLVNAVGEIDGVVTQNTPHVAYEHGTLTELYRPEWAGVFAEGEPIEHLYTVWAPRGGMRREWYFHEHTLDRYMILRGLLDVGLYDGREGSDSFGAFTVLSLGEPGSDYPLRSGSLLESGIRFRGRVMTECSSTPNCPVTTGQSLTSSEFLWTNYRR